MSPIVPFKGIEEPPRPEWENRLFEAVTMEEINAALALRDAEPRRAGVYDEELHPRGPGGRWVTAGGGEPTAEQLLAKRGDLISEMETAAEHDDDASFTEASAQVKTVDEQLTAHMPGDSIGEMMRTLADPDSGSTIALTGDVPTSGYIVALPSGVVKDVLGREMPSGTPVGAVTPLAVPAAEFTRDRETAVNAVDDFLASNAVVLAQDPSRMMGLWHNPETGNVVFDVVEHVSDREEAVRLGAERDQIAIYGITEGDVISTGGTGGQHAAAAPSRYDGRRPDGPGRSSQARGADRGRPPGGSGTGPVGPA